MAALLTSPIEVRSNMLSADILSSKYIGLGISNWVPGLYQWQTGQGMLSTSFNGQRPVTFEIDTLDLPIADKRWKVSLSGDVRVSFDDLRDGRWPKPAEVELEKRREALQVAKGIRQVLDIRPLKTSTMVRQLREGKVEDRG